MSGVSMSMGRLGRGGGGGKDLGLPARGIRASQGTFSSFFTGKGIHGPLNSYHVF